LIETLNIAGAVLLLLALIGFTVTGVTLLDLPIPWAVVVLQAIVAVILGEGAFRAWRYLRDGAGFYDDITPLNVIVEQRFIQETVVLDGKHFVSCSFEAVTLKFNGNRPFRMDNCDFRGTLVVPGSPPLEGLLMLLLRLGLLRPDLPVHGPQGTTLVSELQLPAPEEKQSTSSETQG
jgi:hypothetical protein